VLPGTGQPTRLVASADGTPIAVFNSGDPQRQEGNQPIPVVLVHGTTADHTTFRVVGPMFARRRSVHAIDRRGRGSSGDGAVYAIEREFEDVAAVVEALTAEIGQPVDVVGHSFGGRCALGAARFTGNVRRVVSYEGAPAPPELSYQDPGLVERLRELLADDRLEAVLESFLRQIVGMTDADIEAYRVNPVWPARVAAAPTIVRELEAESSRAASLDALSGVSTPVLQILGGASLPVFGEAVRALDSRLANGKVVVIEGAKHAAHHTHPVEFVAAVEAFLDTD
jgi:pimeloyl-ACP methyl ester carboxylesterase